MFVPQSHAACACQSIVNEVLAKKPKRRVEWVPFAVWISDVQFDQWGCLKAFGSCLSIRLRFLHAFITYLLFGFVGSLIPLPGRFCPSWGCNRIQYSNRQRLSGLAASIQTAVHWKIQSLCTSFGCCTGCIRLSQWWNGYRITLSFALLVSPVDVTSRRSDWEAAHHGQRQKVLLLGRSNTGHVKRHRNVKCKSGFISSAVNHSFDCSQLRLPCARSGHGKSLANLHIFTLETLEDHHCKPTESPLKALNIYCMWIYIGYEWLWYVTVFWYISSSTAQSTQCIALGAATWTMALDSLHSEDTHLDSGTSRSKWIVRTPKTRLSETCWKPSACHVVI